MERWVASGLEPEECYVGLVFSVMIAETFGWASGGERFDSIGIGVLVMCDEQKCEVLDVGKEGRPFL